MRRATGLTWLYIAQRFFMAIVAVSLMVALGTVLAPQRALAGSNTFLKPPDPELLWGVRLPYGICELAICEVLTELVMTAPEDPPAVCLGLLESEAARAAGVILPDWTRRDYRDHLDAIAWAVNENNWSWLIRVTEAQTGVPVETVAQREAVKQSVWPQYGDGILPLFESGEAIYENALFDIDNDGVDEMIYRVTVVQPDYYESPEFYAGIPATEMETDWIVRTCIDDPDEPLFQLFVAADDGPEVEPAELQLFEERGGVLLMAATPFAYENVSYVFRAHGGGAKLKRAYDVGANYLLFEDNIWAASVHEERDNTWNGAD